MRICGAWGLAVLEIVVKGLWKFQSGADLWGVGTCAAHVVARGDEFQSGADLWGVGTGRDDPVGVLHVFQSGADLWGVGTFLAFCPHGLQCFNPVRICGAWGHALTDAPEATHVRCFNPVRICGAWGQHPGLWGL